MMLKELAPAVELPVPLAEFARHLRISHGFSDEDDENVMLALYLRNATAAIEARLSRALIARRFVLHVGCWDRTGCLRLPIGPVQKIDTARFSSDEGKIDLDPNRWSISPGTTGQRLGGPNGGALPPVPPGRIAELGFVAGYGPLWNDVPVDLRQSVLLLAAFYYENRHGDGDERGFPIGVQALLEQQRQYHI